MNMSQLSCTVARLQPALKRDSRNGQQQLQGTNSAANFDFGDNNGFDDDDDPFEPNVHAPSSDIADDIMLSAAAKKKSSNSSRPVRKQRRQFDGQTTSDSTGNDLMPSHDDEASAVQHRSSRSMQPDELKSAARQKELIEAKRLRKRLKFFFLNPIEKFRTRGQFPYKLFMQLVKVFFVTAQLLMFGDMRYQYVNFLRQNKLAFGRMLLQNWTESYDPEFVVGPIPYQYAIETYDQFFDGINYAVVNYRHIGRDALGTYDYGDSPGGSEDDGDDDNPAKIPPMQFCKYFYKEAHLYPNNSTYILNTDTDTKCLFLRMDNVHNNFDSRAYFHSHNFTVNFDTIITAKLLAVVRTVHVRHDFDPYQRPPVCYKLEVKISFDNTGHCGRIPVGISLTPESMNCKGSSRGAGNESNHTVVTTILDIIVFIICGMSLLLCVRAVIRSMQLKRFTDRFLRIYLNYRMPLSERVQFMNGWYIMICLNDVMILLGTFIKLVIQSDYRAKTTSDYDQCGILLGIGNLLVWCGILRYLTFFKKYNILLLTLKRATPNVGRFMVCALCIFLGFSFCGWLVFGPYHYKFHSWPSSCEVLFAEINGDDMYTTFATIGDQVSPSVWLAFRVYLYVFICLFTYVVLSLFISLIMEAYETVKDYQKNGHPMSPLHSFVWHGLPPDADDMPTSTSGGGADDDSSYVYVRSRLPSFSVADEQAAHEAMIEQTRKKRRARAAGFNSLQRAWYRVSHSRCARCLCREDDWDASDNEVLTTTAGGGNVATASSSPAELAAAAAAAAASGEVANFSRRIAPESWNNVRTLSASNLDNNNDSVVRERSSSEIVMPLTDAAAAAVVAGPSASSMSEDVSSPSRGAAANYGTLS